MKKYAITKFKQIIIVLLTLLLAVTGFFAVNSLVNNDGEGISAAYADSSTPDPDSDRTPTADELLAIGGYKIESGKYYIKALTKDLTMMFDGTEKTFTVNVETPINILTQTVDGTEYHVYFWYTTYVTTAVHVEYETPDDGTYSYRNYQGGFSNYLTFATPQSTGSLRIDSAGRIYYPILLHTGITEYYYLSANGFTADKNSASSTTVDLSSAEVTLPQTSYTYTGGAITPTPTVKIGDTTLTKGTHYTVSYENNVNAGTATVTITGTGIYTGTVQKTFTITQASLSSATVSLSADSFVYNGSAQKPTPTVKIGTTTLTENTDYTVSYSSDTTSVGTKTVTITGKGAYTGTVTKSYTITQASLSSATVGVSSLTSYTYTGGAITPTPSVTLNNKTIDSSNYDVTYTNNVNAGTATVTVTGTGNYTGSASGTFTIAAASLSEATVTLPQTSYTYTGGAITPEPTVTLNGVEIASSNYEVTYTNNENAGTATVTVTGKGNYKDAVTKDYTIAAADFSGATVGLSISEYTYNGTACEPAVTITLNGVEIDASNYTVSYENNTGAGTATVIITPTGDNFTGTAQTVEFTIGKAERTDIEVAASGELDVFGSGVTLSATDSSGEVLSVKYTTENDAVNINGNTVTAVTQQGENGRYAVVGTAVTVTATVAASDNYNDGTADITINTTVTDGFIVETTTNGVTVKTAYESLQDAVNAAAKSGADGKVTVVGNPVVTETVTIPDDAAITIEGEDGATVCRAEGFTGNMFSVPSDASLTVKNVTVDGGSEGDSVFKVSGGTLTLDGATVQNGYAQNGGAVYLDGGTLNLEGDATLTNNTAVNGGAVYVASGTLNVESGATLTNNTAENGGAVYVANGTLNVEGGAEVTSNKANGCGGAIYMGSNATVTVEGGKIANNSAATGNGVYVGGEGNDGLTVYGSALSSLSDGAYIQDAGSQITIDGKITGSSKLTVEFSSAAVTAATGTDATADDHAFVVSSTTTDESGTVTADNSNSDLKNVLRVANAGYTFYESAKDSENADISGLTLIASTDYVAYVAVTTTGADGKTTTDYIGYTDIQAAIDAAASGVTADGKTIDKENGSVKVYLGQYVNTSDGSLNQSVIELTSTLNIPNDADITFDTLYKVATPKTDDNGDVIKDENGKITSETTYYTLSEYETYYNEATDKTNLLEPAKTTVKRGESLTDEMICVKEGGSLTLGYVTLDGGAVWGEDGTADIQITDDGNGGAGTVTTNNTGVTAHAPVVVNQGTLTIAEGATIQNNDNNYAAPGEGFGSQNYGGGVRNEGSGTLTMNGGTIQDCYSREGGAIMNVNKPVKYDDYTANSSDTYYVYADGELTELTTELLASCGGGKVQEDDNGYAYVTIDGEKSYLYAGTGSTVTISGGEITGNVSQQKGAAIQTIYGDATTTVKDDATITGNWSLNDLGVLSVEEGGSLNVEGGTVSTATGKTDSDGDGTTEDVTNDNAIYLFNQYSAADYEGYATTPFIEGVSVGELAISGNPTITGDVHIDDTCNVVNPDNKTASDKEYTAVVNVTGYTGDDNITVTVSDGYSGEVAVSTSGNNYSTELGKVVGFTTNNEESGLIGQITYIKTVVEDGTTYYYLGTGAYELTFEQTEPGKIAISGTVDPDMQSVIVTINGKDYTVNVADDGTVNGVIDLSNLTTTGESDSPETDFNATVTFNYGNGVTVDYGNGDASGATGLTEALSVVQLDSGKAIVTVPENTYYISQSGEYKPLESGLLPNDIAIDENGNATIIIGGKYDESNGTVSGGDTRTITIGVRAEAPLKDDVGGELYDASDATLSVTVKAEAGLEYAIAVVTTDGDGNIISYEIDNGSWTTTDTDGYITFENLSAEKEYAVVVRTPATTEEGGSGTTITAIPSEYTVIQTVVAPLDEEEATVKSDFEKAYEAIASKLLDENGEWKSPENKATSAEIAKLLEYFDDVTDADNAELSDAVKSLTAVQEKLEQLTASYYQALADEWSAKCETLLASIEPGSEETAENISKAFGAMDYAYSALPEAAQELAATEYEDFIDAYADYVNGLIDKKLSDYGVTEGETSAILSDIAKDYENAISEATCTKDIDELYSKALAALELAGYYSGLIADNGENMTGDGKTEAENLLNNALKAIESADEIKDGDGNVTTPLAYVLSATVDNAKEDISLAVAKSVAAQDYLDSYEAITGAAADENNGEVADALSAIESAEDVEGINAALLAGVEKLVNGLLVYDGEELSDSADTKKLTDAVIEELQSAVTTADGNSKVADLSALVTEIKDDVESQRGTESTAAKNAIDEILAAAADISDESLIAKLNALGESAKDAIDAADYADYASIEEKLASQIAVLEKCSELLAEADGEEEFTADEKQAVKDALIAEATAVCDAIDGAAAENAAAEKDEGILGLEKIYVKAYLQSLLQDDDSEYAQEVIAQAVQAVDGTEYDSSLSIEDQIAAVDEIASDAETALTGERFLDGNSVLRKDFDDIAATDGEELNQASEAFEKLADEVKDYLYGKAREQGYSSFASLIADEINKSEFEQEKADILSDTANIVKEHDGDGVTKVLNDQIVKINDIVYKPCKDDGGRDDYAQGKSDELQEAGDTAKTEIEHAQAQQRTVNQAIEELEDMIASNKYNPTQQDALQAVIDGLKNDVSGVTSSDDGDKTADQRLEELLSDAEAALQNVPVNAVITGDIVIKDSDGNLTTKDNTGDYGDVQTDKVWGVVTNDSSIPSDVLLVIEETNGDAMKAINEAADSGKLVAAEENTEQLGESNLNDLVSGKDIKATLDIYLLKDNARYNEFEGTYVVKVLMPSGWRDYRGLQVVYVGDNGEVQVYNTTVEDGKYLVFSTTHFSEFYVLGEKEVNLWWLIVTLSVLLAIELIAIAVVLVKRKKKDGEGEVSANAFLPVGSLLAVVVPDGAVAACIALGVCIVAAGAALAVIALKKKRAAAAAEETPAENVEPLPAENIPEGIRLTETAVAAHTAEAVAADTQRYIVIKYNKSFLAKLIQSDDATKSYYADLKNEIMSYGAKSRISWRYEKFRCGKTSVIKMAMRGKTLCLCFALSPSDYYGSKYKTEDYSETAALQATPCVYRIKNKLRCKYAKDLIADVMKKYGVERGEWQSVPYAYGLPYEDTDALVAKGLVKVLTDEDAQSGTSFRPVEVRHEVKASEVDDILSDDVAKQLVESADRYADRTKTGIINVDTISQFFKDGETVTLEEIKKRVPGFNGKTTYVKVLARGSLDKALTVEADDFSKEAVKMIILTGGRVKRTLVKGK